MGEHVTTGVLANGKINAPRWSALAGGKADQILSKLNRQER